MTIIYQCNQCGAPLPRGTIALCDRCADEAAERIRERLKRRLEKRRAELGIWEGIAPEPAPTDGDTQPNATDWIDDCGFDVATGTCTVSATECAECSYRQAIGDVAK